MTDIVLDTKQITINVIGNTDIEVINITHPPYVQVGQPATIEYDVKNNGDVTSCFTRVEHDGNEDHRWDGTISTNNTQHVNVDITPENTNPLIVTIEAGYTYA